MTTNTTDDSEGAQIAVMFVLPFMAYASLLLSRLLKGVFSIFASISQSEFRLFLTSAAGLVVGAMIGGLLLRVPGRRPLGGLALTLRLLANAHRYPATKFGQATRTTTNDFDRLPPEDWCINCNASGDYVSGVEHRYSKELVVAGFPLLTLEEGRIVECDKCAAADDVEYSLRANTNEIPYNTGGTTVKPDRVVEEET
ncbi:hypothetical protein RYH80_18515 [Halobaculum sp. MBLA0147]|uniref:hypothetical protein n=1 Tax=Halobaculum sp. MBLA0147 TaxID=3079934 RepID=UPI0035268069